MRKRTINNIFDNILWYIAYMLPMIAYLLSLLSSDFVFIDFISNVGLIVPESSIIYTTINSIFGSSGILPILSNEVLLQISCWYITTYLIHLVVDVILFIPRFAHKLMEGCFNNEKIN